MFLSSDFRIWMMDEVQKPINSVGMIYDISVNTLYLHLTADTASF
jgi:hypothetical protein